MTWFKRASSLRSTHSSLTAPSVLRVHNSTRKPVRVVWCDQKGQEVEYAILQPGQAYNQSTYSTHPWRVKCAESGEVLCEYVGHTATVCVAEGGKTVVHPGLTYDVAATVEPHSEWGRWQKRAEALGIPIKAYDCVSEEAVVLAARTLEYMLADVDAKIVQLLCQRGAEVAIIGRCQVTTDIPAHGHLKGLKVSGQERTYDDGTRGLGGTMANPITSVGEENLTMVDDPKYSVESILVHEFAHTVMDVGLHEHPLRDAIKQAYVAAKKQGLHDPSSYLMYNECEYWAEGTQAWFNATIRLDATSGMTNREAVKSNDPELASILTTVYGDGAWRYPHTAPRPLTKRRTSATPTVEQGFGPLRAGLNVDQGQSNGQFIIDMGGEGAELLASTSRGRGPALLRPLAACFGSCLPQGKRQRPKRRRLFGRSSTWMSPPKAEDP